MHTRSSSNLDGESSSSPTTSNPKRRNRRCSKQLFILEESPVDTMANQRTMAELLRASTEGYVDAIVVPPILAKHLKLKQSLTNMMTSDQFFGHEKDNPHDHIPPIQQNHVVPLSELEKIKKINEINIKAMKTQINNVKNELRNVRKTLIQASMSNQTNELKNMMASFIQMNTASTSGSRPLPSNTIANPKGELKAITTRSGFVLDGTSVPMPPSFINPEEDERVEETLTDPKLAEYTIMVPPLLVQKAKPPSQRNYVGSRPLPSNTIANPKGVLKPSPLKVETLTDPELAEYTIKQKPQDKDEIQIHKFWQMFKQLHSNITLADALILILKYQKMLKDLLSNKEKLFELANTPLNENCSAVIFKKLPEKLGDPDNFLILCGFNGIVRDVFVLVRKFTFPADFVIVDYESDPRVPLILGRPFLRTARALIDVYGEEVVQSESPVLTSKPVTSLISEPAIAPPRWDNDPGKLWYCSGFIVSEAWDRFKDLLRACPYHGFSELHQLDTFYNALNSKDQDSLNSAAGGNFLDKMPRECLAIIKSKSKVRYSRNKPVVAKVSTNTSTSGISPDVAELKDMVKALLLDKKSQNQSPAPVKAVDESWVTYGGAHSHRNFPATDGNVYPDNIQEFFVNSNSASTSSSGTLPSNTIANPRSDLKAITTRSGVSYDGPQISPLTYFLPKVVKNEPESESPILTSEPVTSLISEPAIAPVSASKPNPKTLIPYPSRRNDERNHKKPNNQIKKFYKIFKDMSFKISFADALILMPKFSSTLKALIGNKEKLSEMARTPLNEHCSTVLLKKLPKKLGDPGKFLLPCDFLGMAECLALVDLGASINLMPFSVWKRLSLPDLTPTCMTLELYDHLISRSVGVAEDVYVKEVLDFSDTISSGNATPFYDPIVSTTSSTLTPFGNSDFLLEEVDAFLAIKDEPTSSEFYQPYLDPEGGILLLEAFLNDDPSLPPLNQRNYLPEVRKELKICEAKSDKSSINPQRLNSKIYLPTSNMHSWKVTTSCQSSLQRI
uniref:Reverse transcriptase domain-containing protein n=1 Tax=Tanacetum cinerariifolium TaxID=118510 RepID=A0A699GGZ1_TANCI|nr:reverse transcriptase domain-containing protein [Tanacetum cinerariifolium]